MSVIEKYQVAGLDDRERGFNRLVDLEEAGEGFRLVFRYEDVLVATGAAPRKNEALHGLVRLLQARGYTQLRCRLSFLGIDYLGNQEPWVEYPDPEAGREAGRAATWLEWLRGLWPGRATGRGAPPG